MKRVLSFLLCIVMMMYFMPTMAFAEDNIQIEITDNPKVNIVNNLYACDDKGMITNFTATNEMESFDVTLKAEKQISGKCRINVTEVTGNVQLIAVDTEGKAWNIVRSGWGPIVGFDIYYPR